MCVSGHTPAHANTRHPWARACTRVCTRRTDTLGSTWCLPILSVCVRCFWSRHSACGLSVPQAGIELVPPSLEAVVTAGPPQRPSLYPSFRSQLEHPPLGTGPLSSPRAHGEEKTGPLCPPAPVPNATLQSGALGGLSLSRP